MPLTQPATPQHSSAARLLLIEDDQDMATLVWLCLQTEGFEVLTSADGEEALAKARSRTSSCSTSRCPPCMVCTRLKTDERYRRIPIVLFTAKAHEGAEWLGQAAGADACVTRTFDPDALISRLRVLLNIPAPTAPPDDRRARTRS